MHVRRLVNGKSLARFRSLSLNKQAVFLGYFTTVDPS